MKRKYKKEVIEALERTKEIKNGNLTEDDIRHLPQAVQQYIRYTGALGKEKVTNFRVEFEGRIRSKPTDGWMPLRSVQYNFVDEPTRIFYITARKMGIPAGGLHLYKDEKAIMKIKIAGLFTVVDASGKEMDQGETVTVFNDMCFMAPATLIDNNIRWETIDSLTVRAKYTNGSISITATLYFNDKGELVNFISNDRFETADGKVYKNYPWITPVTGYRDINGYRLASGARAIYRHSDEDFCYGEFNTVSVDYNCRELK
jgi:hypothetical protein